MQVSVEAPSKLERRLTVVVPVERFNEAYKKRLVKFALFANFTRRFLYASLNLSTGTTTVRRSSSLLGASTDTCITTLSHLSTSIKKIKDLSIMMIPLTIL